MADAAADWDGVAGRGKRVAVEGSGRRRVGGDEVTGQPLIVLIPNLGHAEENDECESEDGRDGVGGCHARDQDDDALGQPEDIEELLMELHQDHGQKRQRGILVIPNGVFSESCRVGCQPVDDAGVFSLSGLEIGT